MIWLPAILWGLQRSSKRKGLSDLFLTIFFLAMSVLGGEPQLFIMTAGLVLFYALILLPAGRMSGKDRTKSGATVVILILAALLLTAMQWIPTYVDYQYSARFQGIGYEEAVRFSLTPGRLHPGPARPMADGAHAEPRDAPPPLPGGRAHRP